AVVDGHSDAEAQGGLAVADRLASVRVVGVRGAAELGVEAVEACSASRTASRSISGWRWWNTWVRRVWSWRWRAPRSPPKPLATWSTGQSPNSGPPRAARGRRWRRHPPVIPG